VKWLAEMTNEPEPQPRDYVPTIEELASLLDAPGSETLRRYDIIALNTWARPEAILELSVRSQVDFDNDLIDLNPPGRKQTKKRRPTIKLTENLRGWLEYWAEDRPLAYDRKRRTNGKLVQDRTAASFVKAQFKRRTFRWMLARHGLSKEEIDDLFRRSRNGERDPMWQAVAAAEARGIKRITPYTLRHFMATKVRSLKEVRVDREQRSLWLGHGKKDTTSWYETLDPEHLSEAAKATNIILEKLDALTKRPLVPMSFKQRRLLAGLSVVNG
jgi:integrase